MKAAPDILVRLLILIFLLGDVVLVSVIMFQLLSGKSLVRLKARQDSRTWFWFFVGFQLTIALIASYIIFLAVFRMYA